MAAAVILAGAAIPSEAADSRAAGIILRDEAFPAVATLDMAAKPFQEAMDITVAAAAPLIAVTITMAAVGVVVIMAAGCILASVHRMRTVPATMRLLAIPPVITINTVTGFRIRAARLIRTATVTERVSAASSSSSAPT